MIEALFSSWKMPLLAATTVVLTVVALNSSAENDVRQYYFEKISPFIQHDTTLMELSSVIASTAENYRHIYKLSSKEVFFAQANNHFLEIAQTRFDSKAAMVGAILRSIEEGCGPGGNQCSIEIFALITKIFQEENSKLALINKSKQRRLGVQESANRINMSGVNRAIDKIIKGKCSSASAQLIEKQESKTTLTYKFECGRSSGGVIGFNQIIIRCHYEKELQLFVCK